MEKLEFNGADWIDWNIMEKIREIEVGLRRLEKLEYNGADWRDWNRMEKIGEIGVGWSRF